MRTIKGIPTAFLLGILALGVAQSTSAPTAKSPFVGTWDGTMNDLPGINLIVADADGGQIGGVVTFCFQMRGGDGKWHIAGKYMAPLLSATAEGEVLNFEVQHHKTHDSPEFGPNAKMQVRMTGANEALFYNLSEPEMGPVNLTRQK